MSLVGTYVNVAQNYKLVISNANDGNGQASGVLNWGPHAIAVNIHYHYEGNTGPAGNLVIWGSQDNPNKYLAAAGSFDARSFAGIQIGITLATDMRVDSFVTYLVRQ